MPVTCFACFLSADISPASWWAEFVTVIQLLVQLAFFVGLFAIGMVHFDKFGAKAEKLRRLAQKLRAVQKAQQADAAALAWHRKLREYGKRFRKFMLMHMVQCELSVSHRFIALRMQGLTSLGLLLLNYAIYAALTGDLRSLHPEVLV